MIEDHIGGLELMLPLRRLVGEMPTSGSASKEH